MLYKGGFAFADIILSLFLRDRSIRIIKNTRTDEIMPMRVMYIREPLKTHFKRFS